MTRSWPSGTPLLQIIEDIGWRVWIEPPSERDELLARLHRALDRRMDALDPEWWIRGWTDPEP